MKGSARHSIEQWARDDTARKGWRTTDRWRIRTKKPSRSQERPAAAWQIIYGLITMFRQTGKGDKARVNRTALPTACSSCMRKAGVSSTQEGATVERGLRR